MKIRINTWYSTLSIKWSEEEAVYVRTAINRANSNRRPMFFFPAISSRDLLETKQCSKRKYRSLCRHSNSSTRLEEIKKEE